MSIGHRAAVTMTEHEEKAARWRDEDHPRDRLGRFIEIGARVRIWGGATGTVLGNAGGRRIEVARDGDGKRFLVGSSRLTVIERPDGGEPTEDARTVRRQPITPPSPDVEANPDDPDDDAVTTVPEQVDLFADLDGAPADLFDPPKAAPEDQAIAVDDTERAAKGQGDADPAPERGHETVEETRQEFNMPADRVAEAIRRVDAANKRAERAGIPGRIGYTIEHYDRAVDDGTGIPKTEEYARFTLDVPQVKHDGYTFVATLTWDEDAGLVTRVRPDETLTSRPEARKCDVCKSARDRKDTYVVRHDASGTETQVGSNCLTQFLGIKPAGLWLLGYDGDLDDLEADPDRERGGLGGGELRVSSLDALGVGLAVMQEKGWTSRAAAEAYNAAGGSKMSTADLVADVLWGNSGNDADKRRRQETFAKGQGLVEEAQAVLDLARTLDGDSEYVTNLRAVAQGDRVSARNLPLLVSALAAKAKRDQEKADREAIGNSDHIGKPGDKIKDVKARVTGVRTIESNYGTKSLVTFVTADGNVVKWWASKVIDDLAAGDEVTIAGTVKDHGEFRGVKETTILRTKYVGDPAVAAKRAAEKAERETEVPAGMVSTYEDRRHKTLGVGSVVRHEDGYIGDSDVYRTGTITAADRSDVEITDAAGEARTIPRSRIVAVDPKTATTWEPEAIDPARREPIPEGFTDAYDLDPAHVAVGQQVRIREHSFDRGAVATYVTGEIVALEPTSLRIRDAEGNEHIGGFRLVAVGPVPPINVQADDEAVRAPTGMIEHDWSRQWANGRGNPPAMAVGQVVRVRSNVGARGPATYSYAVIASVDPLTVRLPGSTEAIAVTKGQIVAQMPDPRTPEQRGPLTKGSPLHLRLSVKKTAAEWEAEKHPRDRRGRFIEVGASVSLWGGGQGTVVSMGKHGRLTVDRNDGKRVQIDSGMVTVLRKADGGTPVQAPREPKGSADDQEDAPAPQGAEADAEPAAQPAATPASDEDVAALFNQGLPEEREEKAQAAHREVQERLRVRLADVPDDVLLSPKVRERIAEGDSRAVWSDTAGSWRLYYLDPDTREDQYAGKDQYRTAEADDPEVVQSLRDQEVSSILSSWQGGSGGGLSVVMQRSSSRLFGTPAPEEGEAWEVRANDALDATRGPAVDAVLRAMHEETQAEFARAGITHVQVYRGFQFDEYGQPGWALSDQPEVPLRPLSSFSTDRTIAERFAQSYEGLAGDRNQVGVLIGGTVPVDRILSIPRTGIGTTYESEVVVIGGDPLPFRAGDALDEQPEADAAPPEAGADTAATIPSAVRDQDATPVGAFAYFAGPESSAWFDDSGPEPVGYLRTNKDDASTTLRITDLDAWSNAVEDRGLDEGPVPDSDPALAVDTTVPDPPASVGISAGVDLDSVAASPEQADAFFRLGLPEFAGYGQVHGYNPDQSHDDRALADEASKVAKAETVADLARRMQDVSDSDLLGDDETRKIERMLAGETVLARAPRRYSAGAPKAGEVIPDSWDYREIDAATWAGLDSIPDGVEVIDPQGYHEQARLAAVSSLVQQWADTSNNGSARSLAMQKVAGDLFGVEQGMEWPLLDPTAGDLVYRPELAAEVDGLIETRGEVYEAFLLAQYDATQERFREAGITHVDLYRGQGILRSNLGHGGWQDQVFTDYDPAGKDVAIPLRPASSFTTDPSVAVQFAGLNDPSNGENVVLTATVPVARILGTARTGWGALPEAEMVVIGGTDTWRVQRAADFDPANTEDQRFAALTGMPEPGMDVYHDDEDDEPVDWATFPVYLLSTVDELQQAIAANPDDPERRAALIAKAERMGVDWAVPADWRDQAAGGDPLVYDPRGTDELTEADYAEAGAKPVDSLSTAKEFAAAIMDEWMKAPNTADRERRAALAARQSEFTVVGAPPLPADWS